MDTNTSTVAAPTLSAAGIRPAPMRTPAPTNSPASTSSSRVSGSAEGTSNKMCSVAWMLADPPIENKGAIKPCSSSSFLLPSPAFSTAFSPALSPPIPSGPVLDAADEDDEAIRIEVAHILMSIYDEYGEKAEMESPKPAKCRLTLRVNGPPPERVVESAAANGKRTSKPKRPLTQEVEEVEEEKVVFTRSGRAIKKRKMFGK